MVDLRLNLMMKIYYFLCGFIGEPTNDIHNQRTKRQQKHDIC